MLGCAAGALSLLAAPAAGSVAAGGFAPPRSAAWKRSLVAAVRSASVALKAPAGAPRASSACTLAHAGSSLHAGMQSMHLGRQVRMSLTAQTRRPGPWAVSAPRARFWHHQQAPTSTQRTQHMQRRGALAGVTLSP